MRWKCCVLVVNNRLENDLIHAANDESVMTMFAHWLFSTEHQHETLTAISNGFPFNWHLDGKIKQCIEANPWMWYINLYIDLCLKTYRYSFSWSVMVKHRSILCYALEYIFLYTHKTHRSDWCISRLKLDHSFLLCNACKTHPFSWS